MQRTKQPQVNDVVKVNLKSEVYYKVISIAPDGYNCEIAELKPDGSHYKPQPFDTTLLIKV